MDNKIEQQVFRLTKVILANTSGHSIDECDIRKQLIKRIEPFILESERVLGSSELVERSIQYLSYTHAFPRSEASIDTYIAMLEVIFDIALPLAVPEETNMDFYKFLVSGIEKAKLTRKADSPKGNPP